MNLVGERCKEDGGTGMDEWRCVVASQPNQGEIETENEQ